ncbi:MAG: NUDIX hydrolase [Rhizobiales bacterium]|nr:NUDIX hydrolase [Hyphomicrobiales bacterium]
MRFCSDCGAPNGRTRPAGDTLERHVCTGCGAIHYENPKVVVGAVCVWDEKILLCRRAIDPRRGFWTVPAGFMEIGESSEQGAARETLEEANARIEILDLLAIYNIVRLSQVQIFYRARMLTPEFSAGIETLELDLFAIDRIPWDDLAFPTVHWVLQKAIELKDRPSPIVPELRG